MEIENIKFKLLDGTNWYQWVIDIKILLIDRGSWSFIEGKEPELPEDATRKEKLDYNTRKDRAYTTIYYGIKPHLRNLIVGTTDGKEAFELLKTHFQPKTRARVIKLLDDFFSLRFEKGKETIGLFAARVSAAVDRLEESGHPLDEIYRGFQLIRHLPPEFNGISQIIYRWEEADFKFDKIVNELVQEEDRIRQMLSDRNNAQNEQGAFTAKSSVSPKAKTEIVKGFNRKKKIKKGVICFRCKVRGHYARSCPQAKERNENQKINAPNVELLSNLVTEEQDKLNWCLDSGATHHFTNNKNLFVEYQPLPHTKMALAIDNVEGKVEGMGTINFSVKGSSKVVSLTKVMYSPNLRRNLLSMSKVDEAGGYFCGSKGKMWVMNKNNEKLFYANNVKGLYILKPVYPENCKISINNDMIVKSTNSNVAKSISTQNIVDESVSTKNSNSVKANVNKSVGLPQKIKNIKLWHKRFSHANEDFLIKTSKNNSVRGLPVLEKSNEDCISCKLAKTKRKTFKSIGKIRSTKPLQMLHMDLCGKMPEHSVESSSYFLTITDDFSRKVTVYPLKDKTEVFNAFLRFQKRAENYLDLKVKTVRTDCGLEFCCKEFSEFLADRGIKHERTNTYSPEMNGVSERYNLTALDGVKALLNSSGLSNKFWSEALLCFTYTWNRICHSGQNKTPFELYHGNKPSVSHLRPFGCLAYVGVPKQKRKKLDMRAKLGIMMGYALHTKGYRIWLLEEEKILETINVSFNEQEMVKGSVLGRIVKDDDFIKVSLRDQNDSSDDECSDSAALKPCTEVIWTRELVPRKDGSRTDVYYRIKGGKRFSTLKAIEDHCKKNKMEFVPDFFNFSAKDTFSGDIDLANGQNELQTEIVQLNHVEIKIPESYSEAVNSPQKRQWFKAMEDEMSVIKERKVWDLIPPPKDTKVLGNRWVYTLKRNDRGEITRYKARLVARGYNQIEGETYDEVFSPVVSFTLIRLFFTILVCSLGWLHCQLDINNAYLYAKLTNEICMTQPQGFKNPTRKGYVCRLNRALYGLHQSSRAWFFELDNTLKRLNFDKVKWSNCVYMFKNKALLLVYVDDIVIFSRKQKEIDEIIEKLETNFDLKILGKTTKLLGIEFEVKKNFILLHQEQYISKICQMFSKYSFSISSLPMVKGLNISKQDCPTEDDEKLRMSKYPYRNLLGCLSFLATRTRPDICFAVNTLSQYQENPGQKHWQLLLKLLGYVKYTSQYKLKLRREMSFGINCYSDADFAANKDDRISMGGMLFLLGTSPISWRTFKQKCVSLSTMEAEYVSLSEAAKEVIWVANVLTECKNLGILVTDKTLFCDNKSAIDFANSPIENNRTKHIDVRYHFLREHIYDKSFDLRYIPSDQNLADSFTKSLTKYHLLKFCNLVFHI